MKVINFLLLETLVVMVSLKTYFKGYDIVNLRAN